MLTQYFHHKIQELGFEVDPFPELSVMIYRHIPIEGNANDFNTKFIQHVRQGGRVFLSSTTIDEKYWL
ncbi:MAG: hypothetical protein AB8H03_24540 [Saprospiraceae bacterium]